VASDHEALCHRGGKSPAIRGLRSRRKSLTKSWGIHYQVARAFVLPVHTDTFGFLFLEVMAPGVPCTSTNHFAMPEIIIQHERTGLIGLPELLFRRQRAASVRSCYDKMASVYAAETGLTSDE